jgi:dihydropteroate synthase
LRQQPVQNPLVTPSYPPPLHCRRSVFDFAERARLMGILNVTPDSFSDGGRFNTVARAVAHGLRLVQEGADMLDVGGESTRPGAAPTTLAEELGRVIPVVRELSRQVSVPISIDTTKAEVARQAIEAGAEIINDVSALRFDPEMAAVAAGCGVPVVLMHMQGTPRTMQRQVHYNDIMAEITSFLAGRIDAACKAGIDIDKIIVDPGIGFGKSLERDNFTILRHLQTVAALGRALLVGPSRKACIARLLGNDIDRRDEGTAAAASVAVANGASIVRVHAVGKVKAAVQVADAIRRG